MNAVEKKAILIVSFGTSYDDARKSCIEPVEELIAKSFSDYEVRRAFTSRVIVKKLRGRGMEIDNEIEALDKLIQEGFTQIYIQPLHTMPGFEYDKIKRQFNKSIAENDIKILLGEPLIYRLEDYDLIIDGLKESLLKLPNFDVDHWLLMGHGTEHFANAIYVLLENKDGYLLM